MSAAAAGVTSELAECLAATPFTALPAAAIEDARRLVLDWCGVAFAGAAAPAGRMLHAQAQALGANGEATLCGGGRAAAAAAALANAGAAHALELDDLHPASTLHPGAPIIAAALAVAERERADAAALLRAVVLGYEAALRIGEAVNPSHYRYFHPTGTVATFGAAAAAGALLGLPPAAMRDALGSAGTQAAGLWEFNADGAMSKPLHAAKAAFNGVLAADLARAGFTAATRILEGPRGFLAAMSTGADPGRIGAGLGRRWKIGETCFKLHACCGHTHTAIDALLELRAAAGDEPPAAIQIETYAPGYAIVREPNPRTPAQAQFSLAYAAAAAWLEGRVGLAQFAPERFGPAGVREPRIAALLPRVAITVADGLTAAYPLVWPARVAVTLAGGRVLHAFREHPDGSPAHPVDTPRLEAKLRTLVRPEQAAAVLAFHRRWTAC